jgi:predicted transcriptional regulator
MTPPASQPSTGTSQTGRFLDAYAEIEQYLRRKLKADISESFVALVRAASRSDPAVGRFGDDLREYAELRNAIVHQRAPDAHAIAEPYLSVVVDIERIRDRLLKPPALSAFAAHPVVVCGLSEHVGVAAMRMRDGDFSQVPIYDESRFVGLLTAETVARWMAQELRENDGLLADVRVAEVLPHAESTENVSFLPRTATVYDGLQAFDSFLSAGLHLNAIVLTESGAPDQGPLGIVTIADVPRVLASVR